MQNSQKCMIMRIVYVCVRNEVLNPPQCYCRRRGVQRKNFSFEISTVLPGIRKIEFVKILVTFLRKFKQKNKNFWDLLSFPIKKKLISF